MNKLNISLEPIQENIKLRKTYKITAPYDLFTQWAQEKNAKKIIQGFRQGKAPLSLFKDDWVLHCAQENAKKIIEEEKIGKLWSSTYSVEKFEVGQEISLKLFLDLYPEFQDIDFSKIELTENTFKVTNKDAKAAITKWIENHTKPGAEDRKKKSEKGDYLSLKITISTQNSKQENSDSIDVRLGDGRFIKEVEEKLTGKSVGEIIEHSFVVPDNKTVSQEEPGLIGQTMLMRFEITKLAPPVKISLDDVLKQFNAKDEADLEKKFEDNLQREAKQFSDYLMQEDLKIILSSQEIDPPHDLLFRHYRYIQGAMLKELKYDESQDLDQFLQNTLKVGKEEFEKRIFATATRVAVLDFLMQHYTNAKNAYVTDEEFKGALEIHKRVNPQQAKEIENDQNARASFKHTLQDSKTISFLLRECKKKEKAHKDIEEFFKLKPGADDIDTQNVENESSEGAEEKTLKAKPAKKTEKKDK